MAQQIEAGSFKELQIVIRDAVREKVRSITDQKDGTILLLFRPLCEEEDEWYGGLSTFGETNDIAEYEVSYVLMPGGSHTITFNNEDGTYDRVNTFGYAELKIADCSFAVRNKIGLESGLDFDDKDRIEENGYAPRQGAVCYVDEKCRIYVAVSGLKQEEDRECALAGKQAISEFMDKYEY